MTTSSYMPGTDNGKADLLNHLAKHRANIAKQLLVGLCAGTEAHG